MEYIVDRIEGDIAICSDVNGDFIDILICDLYKGVKESHCIKSIDGKYVRNIEREQTRRKANIKLQNDLFE